MWLTTSWPRKRRAARWASSGTRRAVRFSGVPGKGPKPVSRIVGRAGAIAGLMQNAEVDDASDQRAGDQDERDAAERARCGVTDHQDHLPDDGGDDRQVDQKQNELA